MMVQVKNLVFRPVLFRLNSGRSMHLAAKALSPEIMSVEIEGNKKVEKLESHNIITILKTKTQPKNEKTIEKKTTRKK